MRLVSTIRLAVYFYKEESMGSFDHMTAQEFREFMSKKYKFNAERTIIGEKVFASKKEAGRYGQLKHLERIGEISGLECQKPFCLLEPFVYHGKKIRGIYYVADFCYFRMGQKIAEDVKSKATQKRPEYIIKKKLFMVKYPDWVFEEYL